ncbi:MAG: hypothetical protein ABI658_14320 [Acidimicrobiales bacterium]
MNSRFDPAVPGTARARGFVDRRMFLAGAGALSLVLATGCGGKDKAGDDDAPTGDRVLGAAFANGLSEDAVLIPGIEQRAPLVIFDVDSGRPLRDNPPDSIDVELWYKGALLTKSTLKVHDEEISTPYYPMLMTLPEAGDYEIRAAFSDIPVGFRASARDKVPLVQVGSPVVSVETPTTTNAMSVTPICTRTPTQCPLHTVSYAKVLETKGPTALLISTPGFCQTAVCGPVLELLVSEQANFPKMRMVHAEVYKDPQQFAAGKPNPETTGAVHAYGLSYEPSLIVANADGIVVSRLDFTWDRAELRAALQRA